ncbi:MAG: hypothetical protein ACKO4Y_05675, partial [Flavobacteriales bacterium]
MNSKNEILSPLLLISRYREGYFPMADEAGNIEWHNPQYRAVFDISNYQPKKSLRKLLNTEDYTVKTN